MQIKKILLVDDEVEFTALLRAYLQAQEGYLVYEVNKAREAKAAALSFKPDIIFLDLMMPEMDGSEVARCLREDPVTTRIPIVFLTASIRGEEINQSDGLIGGQHFLSKPLQLDMLKQYVQKLVE